jgi:hypothetical protein
MHRAEQIPEPWLSFLNALDAGRRIRSAWIVWAASLSLWCTAFPGPLGIWTCWRLHRRTSASACWSWECGAGLFTRSTKLSGPGWHGACARRLRSSDGRDFSWGFKHLRLFALDPYDLALSKLERNIQRDRDDVRHLARTVPFDLEVLRRRYRDELRWQLGNPEREDLTLQLWIDAIEEERSKR